MADRFIREQECRVLTGLSRSTRWRLERQGKFPRRRRLSPNGIGWLLSDVEAWQASRSHAQGQEAA
jgi:prophage regulatory protein